MFQINDDIRKIKNLHNLNLWSHNIKDLMN